MEGRPLFLRTIASRFDGVYPVPAPAINEGAVLYLRPLTMTKLREIALQHKLCKRCLGFGVVSIGEGEHAHEQLCPICRGNHPKTMGDFGPRHDILQHALARWEGVLAEDPVTGEIGPLELTPEVRDSIPQTDGYDEIVRLARGLVQHADQAEKGGSKPSLAGDSGTAPSAEAPSS